MIFQILLNDKHELVVFTLNTTLENNVLPKDPRQSILFYIPKKLQKKARDFVNKSLKHVEIPNLDMLLKANRMDLLTEAMNTIREEYNPKVFAKLEEFRLLHAEHFL